MIFLLNINEVNKIFRRSIIKGFFEPQLVNLDFKKSPAKHPSINDDGLMQSDLLHLFFDIETGSDYPDGDEWFIVDMLFPYDIKLPDNLKGTDYFTTISVDEEKNIKKCQLENTRPSVGPRYQTHSMQPIGLAPMRSRQGWGSQ